MAERERCAVSLLGREPEAQPARTMAPIPARSAAPPRRRQRVAVGTRDRLACVGLLDIDAWMFIFGHAASYHDREP